MPATQAYRTIVVLDIEESGRGDRNDSVRVQLRRILRAATEETLAGADVPADAWSASSTGDGLLVLVSPGVGTASVLRGFLDRLPAELSAHNRSATGPARLRVRAILHAGHIMLDEQGATGEQINLAFRLLDSNDLRARLRAVSGPLVLGVSDDVYRQVVTQRPLGLDPATFAPFEVAAKEVRTNAWVHRSGEGGMLCGHDLASAAPRTALPDVLLGQAGNEPPLVQVPKQLPAPPPHFTGREEECRALEGMLKQPPAACGGTVVLITGTAGTGKTALASHWLGGICHRFPDGQLYADLRGHAPAGPATSGEALEGLLRALCLPPEQIRGSVSELSSRLRERTAGRRMLILLDDAISSAQVQPLKPGPGGSVLVVTSRHRLGGLLADGARLLALGPLAHDAATALLARLVGDGRVASESDSVHRLAQLCGRLPIALCVAGARLAARPRSRVARLVEELGCEQRRLAALTVEDDISVRGAFDLSYQALPTDAARLYRLAGLHPGPDSAARGWGTSARHPWRSRPAAWGGK